MKSSKNSYMLFTSSSSLFSLRSPLLEVPLNLKALPKKDSLDVEGWEFEGP